MSRHFPRRDRWQSRGTDQYRSVDGLLVRRYKGEWWADVAYQVLIEGQPDAPSGWQGHSDTLGPLISSRISRRRIPHDRGQRRPGDDGY